MMQVLKKYIVPMVFAVILLMLFNPVYCSEQGVNYLLIWILIGLPFGIGRMSFWMFPCKMDMAGSLGVMALDFIIAGLIGGFIAMWLLVELIMKVTCWMLGKVIYHI